MKSVYSEDVIFLVAKTHLILVYFGIKKISSFPARVGHASPGKFFFPEWFGGRRADLAV